MRLFTGASTIALKPDNVAKIDDDDSGQAATAMDVSDGVCDDCSAPADASSVAGDASLNSGAWVTAATPVSPNEMWTLLRSGGYAVKWESTLIRRRDFDLAHTFTPPTNQDGFGKTTHLLAHTSSLMMKGSWSSFDEDASFRSKSGVMHSCQPQLVRALLESGADPNLRTDGGSTALHAACSSCLLAPPWRGGCARERTLPA